MLRTASASTLLALCTLFGQAAAQEVRQCSMSHPGGAKETSAVHMTRYGQVYGFSWTLDKRSKGYCQIDSGTFYALSNELFEGASGCRIMMWYQGSRLTMALSPDTPGCARYCSSTDAYESMLPVAFNPSGGCSN